MASPAQALPHLVIGADPGKTGGMVALEVETLAVVDAIAADLGCGWWARGSNGHPAERVRLCLSSIVHSYCTSTGLRLLPQQIVLVTEHQWVKALDGGNAQQVRDQGNIEGVAAGLGFGLHTVRAQDWRGGTGTSSGGYTKNKEASVVHCRARLPGLDLTPGRLRKPHTGLADAGCIAWYGAKKWGLR